MPTRILCLTTTSDLGGAERMLLHLLSRADRSRFEFEVGSLIGGGGLIREAQAMGVPAWLIGMRGWFDAGAVRALAGRMRAGRFDLVQLCGLRAEVLGRPLARRAGARAVVSMIHSPDPWRRAPHIWLDRMTSRWVTCWISVSKIGRDIRIQREKFPPDRILVIPNGIPLPPAGKAAAPSPEEIAAFEREIGLGASQRPRVAFIANLRNMKGHLDLIEALPAVLREFPNLTILCAGRDDSRGAVAERARAAGVDKALKFLGFRNDPQRLIRLADCMILPSHWEGCPVSVLEAMALGRPVLATAVGGIPEFIESGKDGLLISPRDPVALSEGLIRILGDPAWAAELGRKARERALRDYDLGAMVRKTESAWLWALGQGPRHDSRPDSQPDLRPEGM